MLVPEQLLVLEVVLLVVLYHLLRLHHVRLGVDYPVHYHLVLPVDPLRLLLLADVVQRLRRSSLHLDILLVHVAVLAGGDLEELVEKELVVLLDFF